MLRVTIRELLLLTAFFAVCLVALKYADELPALVLANGVLLSLMITTVVALVDRGRRQALACGFAACVAIYLAVWMGTTDSVRAKLVTIKFLDQMHQVMLTQTWINLDTGEEITFDTRWRKNPPNINLGGTQYPHHGYFVQVGHWLWALLLGYLGSRFAGWIYARRKKEDSRAPKP